MSKEHYIIVAMIVIPIVSVFYIPKDKYRLALLSFLTFQAITWASSLIQIQIGLLENPVREFPQATQNSFANLFMFCPMLFAWFIIIFPYNASLVRKIFHYFIFISFFAWYGYFRAAYTDLTNFLSLPISLHIIKLYLEFTIYFIICKKYIIWFIEKSNLPTGEKPNALP